MWTDRTKHESKIEAIGNNTILMPYLTKIATRIKPFAPDTPLQAIYKLDGFFSIYNKEYLYELKAVRGDYNAIFAEYLGEPDNRPSYPGWMVKPCPTNKYPIILFYAFASSLKVYNMAAMKAWYNGITEKKWTVSKIRDYTFNQNMYGHLIPLKELEQFEVELKYAN